MAHILDLPEEVILIIFGHIIQTNSQDHFLSVIPKICKRWKDLCYRSQLWNKFDGSLPSDILLKLSKKGYLQNTKELVFSRRILLTPSSKLERIFAGMPNLKTIDFKRVRKFTPGVLVCLQRNCKNVCELKVSKRLFHNERAAFLGEFLSLQGNKLTSIELLTVTMCSFSSLAVTITNECPNLEKLKLGAPSWPVYEFPLQKTQECCTKLRELHFLSDVAFPTDELNSKQLPGFPLLEVFLYHTLNRFQGKFTDNDLINILSRSSLLKELDIKGHKFISANTIFSLPATQLKSLCISETKLFYSCESAIMLLSKWRRSLCKLDISQTKLECINEVLQDIISKGKMCSLSCLNLSRTKVTKETVIHLIENCPRLNVLSLSSCFSIGGFYGRREFQGRPRLVKLHSYLSK